MKENKVIKLSESEHLLIRPSMYISGITKTEKSEYIISDLNKFIKTKIEYVPGLLKIMNELIDNSIDEFVRTNGKFANKININISDFEFSLEDNGRGIPVQKTILPNNTEIYQPELAWTHARAGTNFKDDNSETIGTNGVGSFASVVFSKEFIGTSDDGKKTCIVITKDNLKTKEVKIINSSRKQGVKIKMKPDLERFSLKKITVEHIKMIEQRLYNLSVAYPDINLKLNNKRIKITGKQFLKMFDENGTITENKDFVIGVFQSKTDEFEQFSIMNGLTLSDGGTHIDYLSNNIVRNIREKIIKKYKTIKPADIKRKLFFVIIMKNFKGAKYSSQTKELLTNSVKEISNYFNEFDITDFSNRLYRNKEILESILDYFKIKEEFKRRQELKGLQQNKKKIKSEKYMRAIGSNNMLFIGEGDSAVNGISAVIGRKGNAFYALKGKPLNAYSASQLKFTKNKELTELYQIIKNEGFKKIIVASDADLDGIAIQGLIIAFFEKYFKEELKKGMLYRFNTPIAFSEKNKKIFKWTYSFNGVDSLNEKGVEVHYAKGLGRWKKSTLGHIIKTDGLNKMIIQMEYDEKSELTINEWYSDKTADKRKVKILNNDFELIKL